MADSDDDDDLTVSIFNHCSQVNRIDSYLKRLEEEELPQLPELISQPSTIPETKNQNKYFVEYFVYSKCPVCLSTMKGIDHIKNCLSKTKLTVKEMIYEIKSQTKLKQRKFKGNRSSKTNTGTTTVTKHSNSQLLLLLSEAEINEQRRRSLEKHVSKLKIIACNVESNETDNCMLPHSWRASYLTMDSESYIVQGFEKYLP